jgi:hypothetical protein
MKYFITKNNKIITKNNKIITKNNKNNKKNRSLVIIVINICSFKSQSQDQLQLQQ